MTEQGGSKDIGKVAVWLVVFAVIYVLFASSSTLWDRDEPRYAQVVAEMVESGDYLVPTLYGKDWIDKPILYYWVTSASVKILGKTELAMRLAPIIFTLLTGLLTYWIALKLTLKRDTALWAMIIFFSSMMTMVVATMAIIDGVAIFFVTLALAAYMHSCKFGPRIDKMLSAAVGIGGAMLAKGPIGVLPAGIMFICTFFARGHIKEYKKQFIYSGLAFILGCGIFALWAIPANKASGGVLVSMFFGRHIWQRMTSPMEGHGGNAILTLPFYIPVLMFTFFPWILLLPSAIKKVYKKQTFDKFAKCYIFSWSITIFVLFSLVATKLPLYIWLIWPPLAIASAAIITAPRENFLKDKVESLGLGLFQFNAFVFAAALAIGVWFAPIEGVHILSTILGLAIFAGIIHLNKKRILEFGPEKTAKIILVGWIIAFVSICAVFIPQVEKTKVSVAIAQAIKSRSDKETPIAMYKYAEPSMVYYAERNFEQLHSDNQAASWLNKTKSGFLVVPEEHFYRIKELYSVPPNIETQVYKGYNLAKGRYEEVVVIEKK